MFLTTTPILRLFISQDLKSLLQSLEADENPSIENY